MASPLYNQNNTSQFSKSNDPIRTNLLIINRLNASQTSFTGVFVSVITLELQPTSSLLVYTL
jgi:hypothetical protein